MDPAVAGLLGAAIGSLTGLAGNVLAHWLAVRDEARRMLAILAKEQQAALAAFSGKAASGLVAMEWVTWMAAEDPEKVSSATFQKYDDEMRTLIPELTSAFTALATIDREAAGRLMSFVQEFFVLDVEIARCEPAFRRSPAAGRAQLATHLLQANALFDRLLSLVGDAHVGPTSRHTHNSNVQP